MSRTAIAAALAREDLSAGGRLVAFSLASYANKANQAWPGTPQAAARAGLSRSRYLQAREQLVRRGLVVVEEAAGGRGRASTLGLRFAQTGPWLEGEINAGLFEAVLGCSRARGPARLLLAAMAALADEQGVVEGLTTDELRKAAGLADSTYRRARKALLASGELVLINGIGGRGNTNRWKVEMPRAAQAVPRAQRVAPPRAAVPLVGPIEPPAVAPDDASAFGTSDLAKGVQDRTVRQQNRPALTGVSVEKSAQDRTLSGLSAAKTPPERAPETRPPSARAGKEPQNPQTHPPNPPEGGGRGDSILIEYQHRTARGRTRRRAIRVDLDEVRQQLGLPRASDHADWQRIRELLAESVGDTTFAIWFEPLDLIALDPHRSLIVRAPAATRSWLRERFSRVIADCAARTGREVHIADEAQTRAMEAA